MKHQSYPVNKLLTESDTVVILGKRWFQRSAGSTYNSVQIDIVGKESVYLEETYGYGDFYLQRAKEWLQKNGYLLECWNSPLSVIAREDGFALITNVIDVSREKDL